MHNNNNNKPQGKIVQKMPSSSSSASINIHDLFRACEIGDRKSVERFLLAGVQIDTPDEDNLTALQVAAANDQVWRDAWMNMTQK